MEKRSVERLKRSASAIEKYRNLHPEEQEWLIELIKCGQAGIIALNILDLIKDKPMSYQQIADKLQLHPATAFEIVEALSSKVLIRITGLTAFAPIDSPRTLARRNRE